LHLPPHERRGPVNQPLFLQGEADNQGLRPEEMPVSRRGALGWIVGGAAVIATGAGASAYFYLNRKSSGGAIPQPISGTPTHRPISPGNSKHFVLTGHSGEVTGVAWGPGGTELASSSKDGTVRLWDIATRQTVQNYQGHHQPVFTVAWSPTGQQLASGGSSVQVWNPMGQITHGPFNLGGEVSNVVWQIDEANLFASTLKNDLHEIQLSTNKGELAEKGISRTAAISPDGKYLALGGSDGALSIFELPTLQRLTYIHQHASAVFGVAWSYDSRQLASASSDRTAKIWDIANHSSQTLPHNSAVLSISWEPGSSNRLATASANGALNIWTLASTGGTATHIPHIGHSGPCTTVAWGTKAIATGSMDKSIIIWTV
ncbi:MAG TPA: WD40 repeat domain-containing protein, partial [Ktedonosporobacter sp.]|nr:WD40 repeat domain-containing protein [Ktedonosporobacter sp.]